MLPKVSQKMRDAFLIASWGRNLGDSLGWLEYFFSGLSPSKNMPRSFMLCLEPPILPLN